MINVGLVSVELKRVLNSNPITMPNIIGVVIKAVVHNIRTKNLELRGLNAKIYNTLFLIEWDSIVRLVTLSVDAYCQQGECVNFFRSFSTFLATNMSLKQIAIKLPSDNIDILKCDDFSSNLNTNSTLERLKIGTFNYTRTGGRMRYNQDEAIKNVNAPILEITTLEPSSTDTPWVSTDDPNFTRPGVPISHLLVWTKHKVTYMVSNYGKPKSSPY